MFHLISKLSTVNQFLDDIWSCSKCSMTHLLKHSWLLTPRVLLIHVQHHFGGRPGPVCSLLTGPGPAGHCLCVSVVSLCLHQFSGGWLTRGRPWSGPAAAAANTGSAELAETESKLFNDNDDLEKHYNNVSSVLKDTFQSMIRGIYNLFQPTKGFSYYIYMYFGIFNTSIKWIANIKKDNWEWVTKNMQSEIGIELEDWCECSWFMSSFSVSALASELCARPEDRIGGYPRKLGGCYRHARSQGTGQGWNIDPSLTALPESPLLPLANFAIEFLNFQNCPDPKIDDFKLLYWNENNSNNDQYFSGYI